jgi:predicted nucleic acid-binding protein
MECRAPAVPPDHLLIEELDPGEADAIAVALEVPGSIVMLDDLRARRLAAQVYGLDVLGTVGILVRARRASLIGPLRPILVHLSTAGVYLTPSLIDAAVKSVGDS